jgi:hypothetical protein
MDLLRAFLNKVLPMLRQEILTLLIIVHSFPEVVSGQKPLISRFQGQMTFSRPVTKKVVSQATME